MTWDRGSAIEARLQRLILEAAFLHREFLAVKAEDNFKSNFGGYIHYAFDNDVIKAFAEPWRWGPEKLASQVDDGMGYGQLLPRRSASFAHTEVSQRGKQRIEEDIRAIGVVRLLSEYALSVASGTSSLGRILQFEPHYLETTQDIDFVEEEANRRREGKVGGAGELLMKNAVLLLRAQLRDNISSPNIVSLIQRVSEVALTREHTGPARRMMSRDNYHRLESHFGTRERISGISSIGHNESISSGQKGLYRKGYDLLERFWFREFSLKRQRTSPASNLSDARSFATLAIINKTLIDLGINERVVLVTGSKELVKIAYDCGPKLQRYLSQTSYSRFINNTSSDDIEIDEFQWKCFFGFSQDREETRPSEKWFDRFSLHYVRHLSAFSKGALVENEDTSKLDDLFHGLFALQWRQNRFRRRDIEGIVQFPEKLRLSKDDQNSDSLYNEVLDEWNKLTMRALEAKRSADLRLPENAVQFLKSRFANIEGLSASQLTEEIAEQVDRQRDRSMLELSDMGARALLERGLLSVRNPPDLFFASLSHTNAIFRKLSVPHYYAENPSLFVEDYDDVDLDCVPVEETEDGDDRQRSYLKFMVLGAVFASAEKWSTALGHAQRAIRTITRFKTLPRVRETYGSDDVAHMSGREAYHLAAVCLRMLAREAADLDKSVKQLALSEKAYDKDLSKKPKLAEKLGRGRYRSERLAQELSRYYFQRWASEISDTPREHDCREFDVQPVISAFTELFAELSKQGKYFNGPMTVLTKVAAATNIIQTATILEFRKEKGCIDSIEGSPLNRDLLRRALDFLQSDEATKLSVETALVRAYKASGAILLEAWSECGASDDLNLSEILEDASRNGVMPYDEWRYDALRKFLLPKFAKRRYE